MKLQLFGAYRRYTDQPMIELDASPDITVAQLRDVLKRYAAQNWTGCDPRLIDASAFATETEVLQNEDVIPQDSTIAVLPPVSGG